MGSLAGYGIKSFERSFNLVQILASLSLGASYFLPLYRSANGQVNRADEWWLFFWCIPVLVIMFLLSNRWLKAAFCVFSILGGGAALFLLTFLATYKSTPLVGFHLARVSIIALVVSWLALGVISLLTPKDKSGGTSR